MFNRHLCVASMLLCCMTLCAEEFSNVKIGDLYYTTIAANKVKVVKPTSGTYTGDITIPASVTYNEKTYKVSAIGDYAFQGCSSLKKILIPAAASEGHMTFDGCKDLIIEKF